MFIRAVTAFVLVRSAQPFQSLHSLVLSSTARPSSLVTHTVLGHSSVCVAGRRKGTSGKRRVGTSVGSPVVVLSYPKKKRSTARKNVVATPRTARRQTVSIRNPTVGSQYGAGFFSDLGGGVGNIFGGLGGGIGSVARGLFGGKKRGTQKGRGISI